VYSTVGYTEHYRLYLAVCTVQLVTQNITGCTWPVYSTVGYTGYYKLYLAVCTVKLVKQNVKGCTWLCVQ